MLSVYLFERVEFADRPRQWRLSTVFFVVSGLAINCAAIRLAFEYLEQIRTFSPLE
jgi:hypothetical protein